MLAPCITKCVSDSPNQSNINLDYTMIERVCDILSLSSLPLSRIMLCNAMLCMMLGWEENKLLKVKNGLNYGKPMEICEAARGYIHYNFKHIFKRLYKEIMLLFF